MGFGASIPSLPCYALRVGVFRRFLRVSAAAGVIAGLAAGPSFAACGFKRAFHRADKEGRHVVAVYRGEASAATNGRAPLVFVADLFAEPGGTRHSYHPRDPQALTMAVGDISQVLRRGQTLEDFQAVANAGWPERETWRVLDERLVERDAVTGRPCLTGEGFLVPITAIGMDAEAAKRSGDCDASKWTDGFEVPGLVLPRGWTGFVRNGAIPGNLAVSMTLDGPQRLAYGMVGNLGSPDELGEASVAYTRQLNRLPAEAVPSDAEEALSWFHAPRSITMVFPGPENRASFPLDPAKVMADSQALFEAWGGRMRLFGCLAELGV